MVTVGLLKPANRRLIARALSAEEALATLGTRAPAPTERVLRDDER
jgi:hypothetical protein